MWAGLHETIFLLGTAFVAPVVALDEAVTRERMNDPRL